MRWAANWTLDVYSDSEGVNDERGIWINSTTVLGLAEFCHEQGRRYHSLVISAAFLRQTKLSMINFIMAAAQLYGCHNIIIIIIIIKRRSGINPIPPTVIDRD